MVGDLEVDDVHTNVGFRAHRDRFGHGFEDPSALVSDVRRVNPPVVGGDARQPDELGCSHQVRRRHQQGVREAHCAIAHRGGDEVGHLANLRLGGRFECIALDVPPYLRQAHVGADVRSDPLPLDMPEVTTQSCPLALSRAHRTGRPAFAENHRGDALPDHAFATRLLEEREVGVIVDVYKARRDNMAGGVDNQLSDRVRQVSHSSEGVATDAHVRDKPVLP